MPPIFIKDTYFTNYNEKIRTAKENTPCRQQ